MHLVELKLGLWQIAKDLLPKLLLEGGSPKALVAAQGLSQISDTSELERLVQEILEQNPKQARRVCSANSAARHRLKCVVHWQVEEFRNGRDKLKGFFVGQIMKRSGGRANPALVDQLLMARLVPPA